jgi:hypothetical protein
MKRIACWRGRLERINEPQIWLFVLMRIQFMEYTHTPVYPVLTSLHVVVVLYL